MSRNVPLADAVSSRCSADILVVGDGLAAVTAAIKARESGKRVLLAAAGTTVAGELTATLYGDVSGGVDGVWRAIVDRAAAQHGVHGGWLDPVVTELTVDELLAERGVELLLYATPIALVESAPGVTGGVLFGSKEGFFTIAAGAVVDATEQGALFRQSGVPFGGSPSARGRCVLYFEFASDGAVPAVGFEAAGFSCRAFRTWPDQVCVVAEGSMESPDGARTAALSRQFRLAVPEIAEIAMRCIPALADSVLAVTSHRPMLMAGDALVTAGLRHPHLQNVFGAGAWARNEGWGDLVAIASQGETSGMEAAATGGQPESLTARLPDAENIVCDVAVAGGGTAGPLAAAAAGIEGAKTVLFEHVGSLGGIGTGGGIHDYYHGVVGGLQDRVDQLTAEFTRRMSGQRNRPGSWFHPEAKKSALEHLAVEAGVRLEYGAVAVEVRKDGDRVTGILAAMPGRLVDVRAAVTVDASGDGDLCAKAGARFTLGRASDGVCNYFSVVPGIRRDGDCHFLNFDGGVVDATDIADLTRARRQGLGHLRRPEGFTPENRFIYISPLLGLRESRHIETDYVLTVDDQVGGRCFPDTIAYGSCHLDDHRLDSYNASDEIMLWHCALGFWDRWVGHELPYRCLLPKGIEGLLIACRALGVTDEAATLFRMQRDMQRVGEAAGVAAALAAARGVTPRQVDVADIQRGLRRRHGGLLGPEQLQPDYETERWRENAVFRQDKPTVELLPAADLCRRLEQTWGSILLWQLVHDTERGAPLLHEVLRSGGPHARWWAAAGLAMLGCDDGADVLLKALGERDRTVPLPPDFPEWHLGWKAHTPPRWFTAAVLLGKIRCREAVAPIAVLLADESPDLVFYQEEHDRLLRQGAAVRALGRIGDSMAIPALRAFLERTESEPLRQRCHGIRWLRDDVGFDLSWCIRLPAAAALAACGAPDPTAAEPYLDHPEPTARRYARRVFEDAKAKTLKPYPQP
jgi:NADPH-dependent 2,4-dienoyl-CoA reductase/sulfur reductase-like enzyme